MDNGFSGTAISLILTIFTYNVKTVEPLLKTNHMICVNIISIVLYLPFTYHVFLVVRKYLFNR